MLFNSVGNNVAIIVLTYIDEAMREIKEMFKSAIKVRGGEKQMSRFIDDIVLLVKTKEILKKVLN